MGNPQVLAPQAVREPGQARVGLGRRHACVSPAESGYGGDQLASNHAWGCRDAVPWNVRADTGNELSEVRFVSVIDVRPVCPGADVSLLCSPPCVLKADFQYAPVAPSPSPAVSHSHMFPLHQFGGSLVAFSSQNIGHYPSRTVPMYRHHPRGLPLAAPDDSGYGHGAMSITGIPPGYGYSLGYHKDHE